MTDIVEQGRLYIRAEAPDYYEKTVVWKMADEIERLREALRHYVSECDCNRGTFIWHDAITGKDLVRDCPKCEPARATLEEKE